MIDGRFRLVTWNLNCSFRERGEKPWTFLESIAPDVALVQESYHPPVAGAVGGEIGGARRWGSWIVPFGDVALEKIPTVPLSIDGPGEGGPLEASHPGAFAAAYVRLDDERVVTVVSVYGMLAFKVRNGQRYAVTTVHRTLSDLTPILDVRRTPAPVVLAGDLNVSPQIAWPDTAAHTAVIERIKAFGWKTAWARSTTGSTFGRSGRPRRRSRMTGSSRARPSCAPGASPWTPTKRGR